ADGLVGPALRARRGGPGPAGRDPQPRSHPRRRPGRAARLRGHHHRSGGGFGMIRFHRLRSTLLLGLASAPAAARHCVAGFPEVYGPLFADAQRALPDPKAMVDAIPRAAPAAIAAEYAARRDAPGFDLEAFIAECFELPHPAGG